MRNKIDKSRLFFVGVLICLSLGVLSLSGCYPFETKPIAPSNLTAISMGRHEIWLYWQDNSDNEDGFSIYGKFGQSWLWLDDTRSTIYYDKGLNPGVTYHYKVKAYNSVGSSGFSNEASATARK